ncbi:MAG: hypothetical protein WBO24_18410 [Nitrospirales bacterium]
MPKTLQWTGLGEERRVPICVSLVVVALVSGLFFGLWGSIRVGDLWANSGFGNYQQTYPNGKTLPTGSSGRTFIYSSQTWGGVGSAHSERRLVRKWNVYTLPGDWENTPCLRPEMFGCLENQN